jgi:hypothetical protein
MIFAIMIKNNNIGKIMILTILVLFLLLGSTSGANDELNGSDTIYSNFEEGKEDSLFIANRGTLPDTIDQEWRNSVNKCWLNMTKMSLSHSEFDKSIVGFGCAGYLIVDLNPDYQEKINDSKINEIYLKIDNYCEHESGISDIPVIFMWVDHDEDIPQVYDPDAFNKAKNSLDFIAARGTVPIFANEDERIEWSDDVFKARHIEELEPYFASFDGPLILYGFKMYSGYIEVGVNKDTPEKVNESSISEVYNIIDEHYEEEGIRDIPVVFIWTGPIVTGSAVIDETPKWMEEYIANLSNEEEVSDNKTIKTPGFTTTMLILCLLLVVKARRL